MHLTSTFPTSIFQLGMNEKQPIPVREGLRWMGIYAGYGLGCDRYASKHFGTAGGLGLGLGLGFQVKVWGRVLEVRVGG